MIAGVINKLRHSSGHGHPKAVHETELPSIDSICIGPYDCLKLHCLYIYGIAHCIPCMRICLFVYSRDMYTKKTMRCINAVKHSTIGSHHRSERILHIYDFMSIAQPHTFKHYNHNFTGYV